MIYRLEYPLNADENDYQDFETLEEARSAVSDVGSPCWIYEVEQMKSGCMARKIETY